MGERGKRPVLPLGSVNFTKVILRPIKHVNFRSIINQKLVSVEVCKQNSTVVITIFCIVCFEAVEHGLADVSNNQAKCADVLRIIRLQLNCNL